MEEIMDKLNWNISLKGFVAIFGCLLLLNDQIENAHIIFGLLVIISGLASWLYSVSHRKTKNKLRLPFFIEGIISFAIASVLIASPEYSLSFLMCIWFCLQGLFQIWLSEYFKKQQKVWTIILINGVFSFSVGVILMFSIIGNPILGNVIVAFSVLIFGLISEYLAFQLPAIK